LTNDDWLAGGNADDGGGSATINEARLMLAAFLCMFGLPQAKLNAIETEDAWGAHAA
jgi:hypothetical protein